MIIGKYINATMHAIIGRPCLSRVFLLLTSVLSRSVSISFTDISVDYIERTETLEILHLESCSNDSVTLARISRFCTNNILGFPKPNCSCECQDGNIAFPITQTCLPLSELENLIEPSPFLRSSLRHFNGSSSFVLEVENCKAIDPSLIHLDIATSFGWQDFTSVDFFSFPVNTKFSPSSNRVRIQPRRSFLPPGSLYRFQYSAQCMRHYEHESNLHGGFVYFVTNGLMKISTPVIMSRSEIPPPALQPTPLIESEENLSMSPLTLAAVIVICVVILGSILMAILHKFFCKNQDDAFVGLTADPFRDYVPTVPINLTVENINQQVNPDVTEKSGTVDEGQGCPSNVYVNGLNIETSLVTTPSGSTGCHDYESLCVTRDNVKSLPNDLEMNFPDDTVWEDSISPPDILEGTIHSTHIAVTSKMHRVETNQRQNYISWSSVNPPKAKEQLTSPLALTEHCGPGAKTPAPLPSKMPKSPSIADPQDGNNNNNNQSVSVSPCQYVHSERLQSEDNLNMPMPRMGKSSLSSSRPSPCQLASTNENVYYNRPEDRSKSYAESANEDSEDCVMSPRADGKKPHETRI